MHVHSVLVVKAAGAWSLLHASNYVYPNSTELTTHIAM